MILSTVDTLFNIRLIWGILYVRFVNMIFTVTFAQN